MGVLFWLFVSVLHLYVLAPTIVYVVCIPIFIRLVLRLGSRPVAIALITVYFLAPALAWFVARQDADATIREAQAQVDAIPVGRISGEIPRFIVMRNETIMNSFNRRVVACQKPKVSQTTSDAAPIRPKRFLVLEGDQRPPYPTNALPAGGGGTERLYLHDNGAETLIGVYFVPRVKKPIGFPVLTIEGWYMSSSRADDQLHDFIKSSLNVSCIDLEIIKL